MASISVLAACGGGIPAVTPSVAGEPAAPRELPPSEELEAALRRSPLLATAVDEAASHRLQVLVSVPDPNGSGWLRRAAFRADAEYFYPASSIKLCIAAAALETVAELREAGVRDHSSASELDARAAFTSDSTTRRRTSSTSVKMLVESALVMSDNDASNDLFDLAGFDGVNERMWRAGLGSVRVRHRLGRHGGDDARITPRIELLAEGAEAPVVIAPREGTITLERNDDQGVLVGESQVSGARVVDAPMSFEEKNRVSLQDLQDLMVAIVRPELRADAARLHLGAPERALLIEALTTPPSRRGARAAVDADHKPLLPGLERVVPRSSLTLASKGGRAYGFVVENAYVADARTGRSFFLSATLYANANGRLNDDRYEYESFASPVLADLGEVVARWVFDDGA